MTTSSIPLTDQTQTNHVNPFEYTPVYNPPQPAWQMPSQQLPFQWYNPANYQVAADNPVFESTLLGRKVKSKVESNQFVTGVIMGVIVNSNYGCITVNVIVCSESNFHTCLLSTLSLEDPV